MKLALLFVFFLACVANARPPVMPTDERDFGLSFSQPAAVFPMQDSDIVWMDGNYFREDPRFAQVSDAQFREFFLTQPLSHLSRLQFSYNNLLMELDPGVEPTGAVRAVHPPDYIRADWMPLFSGNDFVVALDGKGGGISVQGESMVRHWQRPMALVLGLVGLPPNPQENHSVKDMMTKLRQGLTAYRQATEGFNEAIRNTSDELEKASLQHGLTERVTKPYEFTKLLYTRITRLLSGQPISPADRDEMVKRFRSLDYTNGLMPLERGYKEVMMGIGLSSVLEKYNAKYGTNFGVVRPVMLVKLPVKILMPDGTKKQACILYRESHWRADTQGTIDFRERMPKTVVGPVLQGGMQFDIFGRLVDLELPEIKISPLSGLMAHRGFMGQAIEGRCRRAIDLLLAGDPSEARKLEEEVRRLADETEIPDVPSHRPPKSPETEVEFIAVMEKFAQHLDDDEISKLAGRVEKLLQNPRLTQERKEAALHMLLKHSRKIGVATITNILERAHQTPAPTVRRRSKANNIAYLQGVIRSLLFKQDVANLMGDGATTQFFRDLRTKYPEVFWRVFRGTANELLRDLLSMLHVPIDEFYEGNPEYQSMSSVLEAIIRAAIDGEGKTGAEAKAAWDAIELQNGEAQKFQLPQIVSQLANSPLHYMSMLFTAEVYFGDFFPEEFLIYLDPEDKNGLIKAQRQMRSMMSQVKAQMEYLRQMEEFAKSCGGQITMVGNIPVISGGNVADLAKLIGGGITEED